MYQLGMLFQVVDDILDRRTRIGLAPRDRERVVAVAEEFLK